MGRRYISDSWDAVVAGYLGVDLAPGFLSRRKAALVAELFRPGKLIEVEGLSISPGGVVANTGLAMKRFGQRVALMGSVGHDPLGDIAVARLGELGVSSGIRRSSQAGTAYGIVVAPPGMDRIFLEDPGCNSVFTSKDIDYKTVARSRLFHFGYPPLMKRMWADGGVELCKVFKRVRKLGVATSLDMALPEPDSQAGKADWERILTRVLPYVDIFAPSIEEILFMMERKHYLRIMANLKGRDIVDHVPEALFKRLGDRIMALGVGVLMIKNGHRGAYIRTGDVNKLNSSTALHLPIGNWSHRSLWGSSFPAKVRQVRNASGAGDCAVAGFLTALLNGVKIEMAAQYAMLAGRDNLYGADAWSGLSDWRTMTDFITRRTKCRKRIDGQKPSRC